MRSAIKTSAAIAISIALATALGACSLLPSLAPAPTPAPESVSAACDALEGEARASSDAMGEASALLPTDATGSAEMLAAFNKLATFCD